MEQEKNLIPENTAKELTNTKGGANESKPQPVIPVATQPKPLTMEDVGRRY